MVRLSD